MTRACEPSRLPTDRIDVWCCETDRFDAARLSRLDALLSRDERARRDRLTFARDRRDYTLAHALLRTSLSQYAAVSPDDWQFDVDLFGKPSIVESQLSSMPLSFNLSHTRGFVACAVVRWTSVGIDVERIDHRSDYRALASAHLSADERAMLDEVPPAEYAARFVELWTLKEAYVKAVGLGFRLPFDAFSLSFVGRSGVRLVADQEGCHFLLAAPTPEVRMSVAIRGRNDQRRWQVLLHSLTARGRVAPQPLLRSSDSVIPLW